MRCRKEKQISITEECQKAFMHINYLLNIALVLPVLHMDMANDKCGLENNTNQMAAGTTLFQFQLGK